MALLSNPVSITPDIVTAEYIRLAVKKMKEMAGPSIQDYYMPIEYYGDPITKRTGYMVPELTHKDTKFEDFCKWVDEKIKKEWGRA